MNIITQEQDDVRPASDDDFVIRIQSYVDAITRVAGHYRIGISPEQLLLEARWAGAPSIERLAQSARLQVAPAKPEAKLQPPFVVEFKDGTIGVAESVTPEGYGVARADDGWLVSHVSRADLVRNATCLHVIRPATAIPDRRIDDYIKPWQPNWVREILFANLRPYRAVIVASAIANVLTLAGILFSMQVYDRVVPGRSLPTLWVLFGGVLIALVFGFLMRIARIHITDVTGKIADLQISDRVFGHALRVRNIGRPKATGTFISQIRDLEHMREMMTSSTVAAIADVPFFLLFCLLFVTIAGPLVWVPIFAAVLLVLPGLFLQGRLRQLAQASSRESSLRSAMLVETIQGLDDIKSLQAETRFQNLWNHYNEVTATSSMQLRSLVNKLSSWAQTVQGAVYAVILFFGAPLVMSGQMSTGVLVAASMLSSRMIVPLTSLTSIVSRWQQAKVAREGIDRLMALPVDTPAEGQRIHVHALRGEFEIRQASFGHEPEVPVLSIDNLRIAPGERVAILGRNGAGKSTLLLGLSGLLSPISGDARVDGLTMDLVDPADLRRDLGYLGQGARLFHGTLRENLALGAPLVQDAAILEVLENLGLGNFLKRLPDGLDHLVQEGGIGLSGGQRQGLLLARLLLRRPRVLLLDEPTASLDDTSEGRAIDTLAALPADVGIVIATHRTAVLRLVNRLIVVNNGTVVMDGDKDAVLARLRGEKVSP